MSTEGFKVIEVEVEREGMHTHCVLCIKVTRRRMQNGETAGERVVNWASRLDEHRWQGKIMDCSFGRGTVLGELLSGVLCKVP